MPRSSARDWPRDAAQATGAGATRTRAARRPTTRGARRRPGSPRTSASARPERRGAGRARGVALPAPRVAPPAGRCARSARSDDARRARRTRYGKSYRDIVRAFRGASSTRPTSSRARATSSEVERGARVGGRRERLAVIPYGGGTSVVGGVEPRLRGALRRRGRARPRRARPRARGRRRSRARRASRPGAAGPRARGAARRARPDAALLPAVVRALDARRLDRDARGRALRDAADAHRRPRRVASARSRRRATWESRRLPGSGAGPTPDRLLLGSEGTLGVITEAWVRVQPRPPQRARRASVRFARFAAGAEAVRAIAQSGLRPGELPADRRARGGA